MLVDILSPFVFPLDKFILKSKAKFGDKYERKAELAGGIILVLIGLKILLEHMGIINF